MSRIEYILLDCDGVLADFCGAAASLLNRATGRKVTVEDLADRGLWAMESMWDLSLDEFWAIIDQDPQFWLRLEPFPWARELYDLLTSVAPVIISTSPPDSNPQAVTDKIRWLCGHLPLSPGDIMIGRRKALMAKPSALLIDDFPHNTQQFCNAGGMAITVPSNWNTRNLNLWHVFSEVFNDRRIRKMLK